MIKVIAIGNILNKDDGIAIKVLNEIQENIKHSDIEIMFAETDILYYADRIQNGDYVILIDAIIYGDYTGSISVFDLDDILKQKSFIKSHHKLNIIDIIRLYNIQVKGCLIGINVCDTGFGTEFSKEIQDCFKDICKQTEYIIGSILSKRY